MPALQGIRFLTKNHGAVIFGRKINKVAALRMLRPQPGPATLFFLARPAQLSGDLIFFGWRQARSQDLFFARGRDFIFRGFRAKGKRSVQPISIEIVCLAGLGRPVTLFLFGLAGSAVR